MCNALLLVIAFFRPCKIDPNRQCQVYQELKQLKAHDDSNAEVEAEGASEARYQPVILNKDYQIRPTL